MKKIIYILLGLALAAVVAIAALVSLIDPNQFKPQLVEQVRKSTGRELVIQGDIGWRFWPSLGLSLEQVALRNPAGFAEPDLVRFTRGEASVGLLPLLSHKLEIGKVTLSGAHLFIQTKADGSSNLRDLLKASAEPRGRQRPPSLLQRRPRPPVTSSPGRSACEGWSCNRPAPCCRTIAAAPSPASNSWT